jgi:serine/threonine protein phosphatase PrpC
VKNFLQKIFGIEQNKTDDDALPQTGEIVTAPLSPEQLNSTLPQSHPTRPIIRRKPGPRIEPPQLIVGLGQSVGRQREVNQDTIYAFTSTLASNSTQVPFGFFVVADGMGGHQHGEVASEIAARIMAEHILQDLYLPIINPNNVTPTESLQEVMKAGVQEAHQAILHKTPDGGTTMTACLILGRQMTIAHVGDSRAYHVTSDGQLQLLTRDHSLVRRLEEMGQITSEEAQTHPQRNVLYRALGQGEPFDPEIQSHRLPQSGYLLICSDGLWGVVEEKQISTIISTGAAPQVMCQQLVDMANDAGGPDNISIILVKVSD